MPDASPLGEEIASSVMQSKSPWTVMEPGAEDFLQAGAAGQRVLVVDPFPEDHQFLRSVFETVQWTVRSAFNCREARNFLCLDRPAVIICEWDLPDGSWRDILGWIAALPDPPAVLVASSDLEDARWAEVLNLGAYDMLSKPFERSEVVRVSSLATLGRGGGKPHRTSSATARG